MLLVWLSDLELLSAVFRETFCDLSSFERMSAFCLPLIVVGVAFLVVEILRIQFVFYIQGEISYAEDTWFLLISYLKV